MSEKTITVVYKTYGADLKWLYYSLLSLKKFVQGVDEILIYCHDISCGELFALLERIDLKCRVLPVHYDMHGYIKQMIVKACCFNDVTTQYVAFLDSDNVFKTAFNFKDRIASDKIDWVYCRNLPLICEERVWQTAYQNMTKQPQNAYYMINGFPFVMTTMSLKHAYDKFIEIHGCDYNTFCRREFLKYDIRIGESIVERFQDLSKIFEEFEWLGFYCHNFSNEYNFIPSDIRIHDYVLTQFWSHGGLSDDTKIEIESWFAEKSS